MKPESKGPMEAKAAGLAPREIRTCLTCGAKFSATGDCEFCPVCALLAAAAPDSAPSEALNPISDSEQSSAETGPTSIVRRFENYEVMLDRDGKPMELGRGAMGITYKAFDHWKLPPR